MLFNAKNTIFIRFIKTRKKIGKIVFKAWSQGVQFRRINSNKDVLFNNHYEFIQKPMWPSDITRERESEREIEFQRELERERVRKKEREKRKRDRGKREE